MFSDGKHYMYLRIIGNRERQINPSLSAKTFLHVYSICKFIWQRDMMKLFI
jgi:hypothetical protein